MHVASDGVCSALFEFAAICTLRPIRTSHLFLHLTGDAARTSVVVVQFMRPMSATRTSM